MLTDRQKAVLEAIWDHWIAYGCSPTLRELSDVFGFSGPNAVAGHLKLLVKKGAVEVDKRSTRGIWPTGLRLAIADLSRKLKKEASK